MVILFRLYVAVPLQPFNLNSPLELENLEYEYKNENELAKNLFLWNKISLWSSNYNRT